MDSAKAQLADKLKGANNVLVTVSRNPSVDQLSACIGLTLLLNKSGKHAAAVFSGEVPSTIEFLEPEQTIEKNTDSLRDFIIALDKSKADKLRYKVEDDVVRIFITPYKTSISQADLEFSQGDFNVDVVVAIGVGQQEDLDMAITAHGRILHDATVTSINTTMDGGLGSINWHDPQASSLSELVTELAQTMNADLLDPQIATALLTGIVAETERFSNAKTSSQTMSVSASLMAAGANQQLVATKLDEPVVAPSIEATDDSSSDDPEDSDSPDGLDGSEGGSSTPPTSKPPKPNDGTLEIAHDDEALVASDEPMPDDTRQNYQEPPVNDDTEKSAEDSYAPITSLPGQPSIELPAPEAESPLPQSTPGMPDEISQLPPSHVFGGSKLMTEAPTLAGTLTANSQPEDEGFDLSKALLGGSPPVDTPKLLEHTNTSAVADTPLPVVAEAEPPRLTPPLIVTQTQSDQQTQPEPAAAPSSSTPDDDITTPDSPTAVAAIAEPLPEPIAANPLPEPLSTPQLAAPAEQPTPPKPAARDNFIPGLTPPPPAWVPPSDDPFNLIDPPVEPGPDQTLKDLEQSVHSPHLNPANVDVARDEVNKALDTIENAPEPIQALNAQPLGQALHDSGSSDLNDQLGPHFSGVIGVPAPSASSTSVPSSSHPPVDVTDPTAPPPVPPPIPFQFGTPGVTQNQNK